MRPLAAATGDWSCYEREHLLGEATFKADGAATEFETLASTDVFTRSEFGR